MAGGRIALRMEVRRERVGRARGGWLMDILGIGTDIIECPRIGKMVENHGELFLRRVYTDREIRFCQSRKHAIEHFAGLWAAKEAILKALGTGWSRRDVSWTDIEVRQAPQAGSPRCSSAGEAKEAGDPPGDRRHPHLDLALPDLRHGLRPGRRGPGIAPKGPGTRGLIASIGMFKAGPSSRPAPLPRDDQRPGRADHEEDDRGRFGHRRRVRRTPAGWGGLIVSAVGGDAAGRRGPSRGPGSSRSPPCRRRWPAASRGTG